MSIGITGWGSFIWDRSDLPVGGDREPGGPVVAIEFRRISAREGERVDASSSSNLARTSPFVFAFRRPNLTEEDYVGEC
jgi:hypothetical protein